ncbi:hypothetical protein C8J57DRAFT_1602006 [Mycena rebaudengoi]|nr:hypothetical protein C8J57DRAFT_1602006 [Mycena rebaudengoi]
MPPNAAKKALCELLGDVDPTTDQQYFEESGSFSTSSGQLSSSWNAIAVPAKKIKTTHSISHDCGTVDQGPPVTTEDAATSDPKRTASGARKQGASVFIRAFTTVLSELEEAIFLTKTRSQLEESADVATNCIFAIEANDVRIAQATAQAANLLLPTRTEFTPFASSTAAAIKHHRTSFNWSLNKTAQDYYRALQKLTDNAFPNQVPDRYREFIRVIRVWRHLALRRRSGQAQDIDSLIPSRRPGSLAVRCPACPKIGFNIDKETIDSALECEQHKFSLFLSSDGNFKLQRKRKVDDPDDVALNAGNAYFPEDTQYQKYVAEIRPSDDKCTCSDLKAVRMQNISKFKNSVISGVVAVQCARHGFFMPGGLVDLTKGEGYPHTDYALRNALADGYDHRWIFLTYDVYCQYFKFITSRFQTWFPSLVGLIERLRGAVPKMHIRNHVGQCQSQWSTNFTEYVGFLIGELIEGSWAEMNQFAGSTKEENHGHRHDSLDDGCGQWNWDKLINMGPPTHRGSYEKLMKAELVKNLAGDNRCSGNTEFIARGLRIEKEQSRITRILKASTDEKLVGARSGLRKELTAWRVWQCERFPHLQSKITAIQDTEVEKEPLFLPSSFNKHTRAALGMADVADIEYKLREGLAHDGLADVRLAIKTFNFNLAFKISQIQGQSANTRAQNFLRILANDRIIGADEYRRARSALLSLGLPEDDPILRHLVNDDLYAKNTKDAPKMGESGKIDPWFWTVGRPAGLSPLEEAEWSIELDRVKWFRDRATRDRAVEQKEIVEEEFSRTAASFTKYATTWRAIEVASGPRSGRAAYAHLKDDMYTKLAAACVKIYQSAPGLAEEDRVKEEAEQAAELKKKGLLNTKPSDSWKACLSFYSASMRLTRTQQDYLPSLS